MRLTSVTVGLPVSGLAAARAWYAGLLGQAADLGPADRPGVEPGPVEPVEGVIRSCDVAGPWGNRLSFYQVVADD
jgi:hypothetical protein